MVAGVPEDLQTTGVRMELCQNKIYVSGQRVDGNGIISKQIYVQTINCFYQLK